MRALLIDDSRAMRTIIGKILKQAGFEVVEAGNGREGLERLRQMEAALPDLALVDWNMPEMDGYQFVQSVRADPAFAAIRLMMITTETETSRVAAALDAGADEYLMKPFTREALLSKLDLLGIGQAHASPRCR